MRSRRFEHMVMKKCIYLTLAAKRREVIRQKPALHRPHLSRNTTAVKKYNSNSTQLNIKSCTFTWRYGQLWSVVLSVCNHSYARQILRDMYVLYIHT